MTLNIGEFTACATNRTQTQLSKVLSLSNSESILRTVSPMTEPCLNSPCMVTLQDTQPLKQSASNLNGAFLFLLDYLRTANWGKKKKTNIAALLEHSEQKGKS